MSKDGTTIHRIKKKIEKTRHALANFEDITARKDLLNIISNMGDLLEKNGFNRDPFKDIKSDDVSILHDYLPNGEPSASNYAAQAVIHAKRAIEFLSREPSNVAMQDLAFNAMRAQSFSNLASFTGAKLEQDLSSRVKPKTFMDKSEAVSVHKDKLLRRQTLANEALKLKKDIITYVAEKEGISLRSAAKYMSSKGILRK